MKQLIRLTESDLHNIVRQVINEKLPYFSYFFYEKFK